MGDAAVSFEREIKPLFRDKDRERMEWAFDLWAYQDVKDNAEAILERLEDWTMTCDQPWESARVQTFRAWIGEGCPP